MADGTGSGATAVSKSLLHGGMSSGSTSAPLYFAFGQTNQADSGSETNLQVPVRAGTLKNFALQVLTAWGASGTVVVRKNAGTTALSLSITTSTGLFTDTSDTVTTVNGDLVDVSITAYTVSHGVGNFSTEYDIT